MRTINLYLLAFSTLFLCCGKPKPFKGYIVCKEYYPARMSDEKELPINYSAFVPVYHPVVVPRSEPTRVPSKFVWHVANKYEVRSVELDSLTFISRKCGDLVIIKH